MPARSTWWSGGATAASRCRASKRPHGGSPSGSSPASRSSSRSIGRPVPRPVPMPRRRWRITSPRAVWCRSTSLPSTPARSRSPQRPEAGRMAPAPGWKLSAVTATIAQAIGLLDRVPYALLAIPLRIATATVFWNSAMTKLANWQTTLSLFSEEYNVPLLPPELAAYLATSIELTTPVLLVLGLFTRLAALVLLGMTAVIEIFVYPQAWPTHVQWAAMLLVLLARGAGSVSIDHWLWRRFGKAFGADAGQPACHAIGRGQT